MQEENKKLVRSFFERGNSEEKTPLDLCARGFTAHIGGYPAMDLQAFQKYQEEYFASFSDTSMTIEDMVVEDDKVAFRGVVRAIHSAEFKGIPARGKHVVVTVSGIAKISDGKIAEWWNYPDRLSWMQQIGAIPS
ncbi:MAG: ester cyclase [Candidatus Thorarchaeota archaeon]|jgi:steroid delta-isomerase-like uncharacterized protein